MNVSLYNKFVTAPYAVLAIDMTMLCIYNSLELADGIFHGLLYTVSEKLDL
jgi:hypothetical protein